MLEQSVMNLNQRRSLERNVDEDQQSSRFKLEKINVSKVQPKLLSKVASERHFPRSRFQTRTHANASPN